MKRREFLRTAAGILIACRLDPTEACQAGQRPRLDYPTDLNTYLHVGEDGHITAFVGKVELGQGNMTALAQLVADELRVPLASVEVVMGDTERCPWDLGTFGSMSIAVFGPVLQKAAAEAREVLKMLASEHLGTPVENLATDDGAVFDSRDRNRRVSYGALARGQALTRRISTPVSLMPRSSYAIIGRSVRRLDAEGKVTGSAHFAGDMRLPGMLYAEILRPPAHSATLKRVDTSASARVPGARVVRDGDLVAVLHEYPDQAARARALIVAEFDRHAPPLDDTNIYDHLVQARPEGRAVVRSGDVSEGRRLARRTFSETYRTGYVAHAPIETHSALASFDAGRLTVWASTQAPFMVKAQLAQALGLPAADVCVVTPFVGGGFGGKTMAPQAVEAARLARIVNRPVQVVWNRREEFFYDTFRPAAVVVLNSALDAAGHIVLWEGDVYGAGEGGATPCYDIPHQRVTSYGSWQTQDEGLHPFGVGAWRAPAFTSNVFAREQQIDIMAEAAGADPLSFRLAHAGDLRLQRVLRTAAERAGWIPAVGSSRRGIGMACGVYANTRVAMFASVSVDRGSGQVRVNAITCAQDMGLVVNPDGARAQIEGCVVMGLGSALSEEVPFSSGAIAARNFDSYPLPRFSSLPDVEITIVKADDQPPSAGGEPAVICVAAAIANAVADAIGVRVTQLPMTPARVREALTRVRTAVPSARLR